MDLLVLSKYGDEHIFYDCKWNDAGGVDYNMWSNLEKEPNGAMPLTIDGTGNSYPAKYIKAAYRID